MFFITLFGAFYVIRVLAEKFERIDISAEEFGIDIVDLTHATNWKDLSDYYGALEKHWKMCINCGTPSLGTAMHLEHTSSVESMHPAVIPSEYLMTRLVIIDVSSMTRLFEDFVLTLDVALQWTVLRHDPREPTLLLFKFGWQQEPHSLSVRSCVCKIPGLSYELAEWISANLTHVVGVATDAPTLESEQTREFSTRTVANLLGKSGIYMIENVNIRRRMPEHGCMAIALPLKLLNANYVPTRLTAFCPASKTDRQVALALKKNPTKSAVMSNSRIYDVNLEEILN